MSIVEDVMALDAETAEGSETRESDRINALLARLKGSSGVSNLSSEQRRFWVLDMLAGGACNHVFAAVKVSGPLDVAIMRRCLQAEVGVLDAAAFKVVDVGGIPLRGRAEIGLEFTNYDFAELTIESAGQRAKEVLGAETSRPFALGLGGLLRAAAVCVSDHLHIVLLVAHRIAFDRRSLELLLKRASGLAAGRPGDLNAYVRAERAWLESEAYSDALARWAVRVEPAALDLALDFLRPRRRAHRGHSVARELPRGVVSGLARRQLPVLSACLVAFEAMVARFTGQNEFAVGLPERRQRSEEGVIGPYGETHVMQAALDPDVRLATMVASVAEWNEFVEHEPPPPAAALIDEVVRHRDLSRTPLFEVAFEAHLESAWVGDGGALWTPAPVPSSACVVDVALRVLGTPEQPTLELCVNAELMTEATADRMLDAVLKIVAEMERAPDTTLGQIDLFEESDAANRSVLEGPRLWSVPARLHQLFEQQCAKDPTAPAIFTPDAVLSYEDLNTRANRLARHLLERGIKPEDRVALCLERSAACYVAVIAVHKAGAAYVPLDPAAPAGRLAELLSDCGARLLVTHSRMEDRLADLGALTLTIDDPEAFASYPSHNPELAGGPENLAYVIYTSGSTGRPNGVEVSHGAAVNNMLWRQRSWPLSPSDRVLSNFAVTFDPSVWGIFWPLIAGAAIVVLPEGRQNDSQAIVQIMRAQEVSVYGAVPALLDVILDEPGIAACSSLRLLPTGGEALLAKLRDKVAERLPEARLLNMYGPTETTIDATFFDVSAGEGDLIPIGAPLPNVRAYVLDEHFRPVPRGVAGELFVAGANLARGYSRRPALTATRFIPDPFSPTPGARMYRTGDRARIRDDGEILFLGRKDEQVKLRGYRVELGEIDAALLSSSAVREAATLAIEDARGQRLVSWVSTEADPVALKAHLAERLPPYMLPAQIVIVPQLPRTPHGKIDRRCLAQNPPTMEHAQVVTRPLTPLEGEVAQAFASVLGLDEVGPDQTFFELGGNSLLITRLASRLAQTHAIDLPVHLIFDEPTVAGVASVIEVFHRAGEHEVSAAWTPERLRAEGELPDDVVPLGPLPREAFDPQRVLVTGATGFIGAYIIESLLRTTTVEVWCLVRASDQEAGLARVKEAMSQYGIWRDTFATRIRCVQGDIAKSRLGLAGDDYDFLSQSMDAIYHAGALVNFLYPYSALKPANVGATIDIMRLACAGRQKILHFPSTIDVLLTAHVDRPFLENDEALERLPEPDGYRRSKWVAEKLVAVARARGVPVCVYRLGLVVGHTTSGATQMNGYIAVGLKGFIELGFLPEDNRVLDLIPVDYAAAAIVHLSRRPDSLGKVFHLWNPQPVATECVYRWVRSFGYPLPTLSANAARERILGVEQDNPLYPLVPLVAREAVDRDIVSPFAPDLVARIRYADECANTVAGLETSRVECAVITEQLTHLCLAFLVRAGFIPPPGVTGANARNTQSA